MVRGGKSKRVRLSAPNRTAAFQAGTVSGNRLRKGFSISREVIPKITVVERETFGSSLEVDEKGRGFSTEKRGQAAKGVRGNVILNIKELCRLACGEGSERSRKGPKSRNQRNILRLSYSFGILVLQEEQKGKVSGDQMQRRPTLDEIRLRRNWGVRHGAKRGHREWCWAQHNGCPENGGRCKAS